MISAVTGGSARWSVDACYSLDGELPPRTPRGGSRQLAEIRLSGLGVLEEVLGRVGQDHLAGLDDVAPVGDLQRHVRVLLDEEDRGALLVDLRDRLEDLFDQDRSQAH